MAHGFRSSFRDWAAEETDHPGEVIKAALAHVVHNKVELAYVRSDLCERRRRLKVCRKRPFTTPADRLRLPRQRRSAAAQLWKAYLPVNISVQEREAANVSWYSKSGSSALAACRSYPPRVSISSSIE